MLNSLKENLINILMEKNKKIIPENIKAGVTIFGITGTYNGENQVQENDNI